MKLFDAEIKVMLQPGGTDEKHKFMVQSIFGIMNCYKCISPNQRIQYPMNITVLNQKKKRKRLFPIFGPNPPKTLL